MDSHVIGADLNVGLAHIPLCGIRRERGVKQQCVPSLFLWRLGSRARCLLPLLAIDGYAVKPPFDTNLLRDD